MNFHLRCLLVFIWIHTILIYSSTASNSCGLDSNDELTLEEVSKGANIFSRHLFKVLSHEDSGNMVCSPISVRLVLSMVLHGSTEDTFKELESVLRTPLSETILKCGVKALLESLNDVGGVDLILANKIYVHEAVNVSQEFSNIVRDYYNSSVDAINFEDSTQAATIINNWIEDKTRHQIQNAISPSHLTGPISIILINAVYFYGFWANKFDEESTYNAPFYLDNTRIMQVEMMKTVDFFNWGDIPDFRARYIELPYKTNDSSSAISMFIIIPLEKGILKTVKDQLYKINFTELTNGCLQTEVHLPRFKVESEHNLKRSLQEMGIKRAFGDSAQLDIIEGPSKISYVFQKAFIEVSEEGTKAAAETAIGIRSRSRGLMYPDNIPVFKVDSPFLSIIIDKKTQTELFIAQIINPQKYEIKEYFPMIDNYSLED